MQTSSSLSAEGALHLRTCWSAAYASTSSSATVAWQQQTKPSTSCVPSPVGTTRRSGEERDLYAARVQAIREAESTSTDAEASAKIEAVTPVAPRVEALILQRFHIPFVTDYLVRTTVHPSPSIGYLLFSVRGGPERLNNRLR